MQVQHEARLLEPTTASLGGSGAASLSGSQPLDGYCLTPHLSNGLCPIERLACTSSPGGLVAAHLGNSNQIVLFDAKTHQRRDRFPLKACDKKFSRQSFQVSAIDFSPDGQRLAVGQSDCIIYIYKLAQAGGPASSAVTAAASSGSGPAGGVPPAVAADPHASIARPTTISGKFAAASPITCLLWTELGILFGSQDGRVRLILGPSQQRAPSASGPPPPNGEPPPPATIQPAATGPSSAPKVIQVHQSGSMSAMPISLSFKAPLLLIGQLDCRVQLLVLSVGEQQPQQEPGAAPFELAAGAQSRRNSALASAPSVVQLLTVATHSCPPVHLSLLANNALCCAGSDGRLAFHLVQQAHHNSHAVSPLQVVDLKEDIQAADYSPVSEILAVATRRRLMFVKLDQESSAWRLQPAHVELRNLVGLASVRWLRDGTQLALGHSNAALDLFRCSWQKQALNEQLDICHIARNRIRITDRERNLLATYKTQHDIKRVNILDRSQSVLIWTAQSLLLARLNCSLQSEIKWPLGGPKSAARAAAKFLFEPSGFVLVHQEAPASEGHLVKLGEDSVRLALRPAPTKRALISVRQYPPVSELHRVGQSGSSPTARQRANSSATSGTSRANSARSARNSLAAAAETAGLDDSLPPANLSKPPIDGASQYERLAYVSGERRTQLNIVDLKRANQLVCAREFEHPIELVRFSFTSCHLIVLEAAGESGRLHLLELLERPAGVEARPSLVLECCHFADWLPETDALVVQVGHQVRVLYDLAEAKRVERLDCRRANYGRREPLLDLRAAGRREVVALGFPRVQRLECAPAGDQARDQLVLSNGQRLSLDATERRFHAEVSARRLEGAFELLQRQLSGERQPARRRLLAKLGWLAIEQGDCQLATRVFARINHSKLVAYLAKCLGSATGAAAAAANEEEEEEEEADEAAQGSRDEGAIMLAKLCGHWTKFEELAGDQELVLATYKRLNKWSLCLDYLARAQQFRQRDIAELERQEWLIGRGRFKEAAQCRLVHSGDLAGALELLVDARQFAAASDLFLAEQKTPLDNTMQLASTQAERRLLELAHLIQERLLAGERDHLRAARMSANILGRREEALDLFVAAQRFDLALELAGQMDQLEAGRVRAIHRACASHLEDQFARKLIGKRRAQTALAHLIEAGDHLEAVEFACRQLGARARAAEIVREFGSELAGPGADQPELFEAFKTRCSTLAREFARPAAEPTELRAAVELFQLAGDFESAVGLLVELGELEQAFQVALTRRFENDAGRTREHFAELASELARDSQKLARASQIYVLIGRPELAIALFKERELYEDMLELVAAHQPDQLEASLLQLARSLELAGRFEEAERCLIRASPAEWTSVVRMYRLAQRWPDAFRVAHANCLSPEDPLLVQLAYWWARSLAAGEGGAEAARTLLADQLQLVRPVVEFCCETKNYQFASELLGKRAEFASLERDVVLRHAAHLERQHKFAEAERVLMAGGLVEAALRMYQDNDLHQEAIQLIERALAGASEQPDGAEGPAGNQQLTRPQLVDLLNETLVQCGRRLADEMAADFRRAPPIMRLSGRLGGGASPSSLAASSAAKLQAAQQMFLRAQRPELAIEMYQTLGMWQEAIQVAQRFAPRLLEAVERALDEQVSGDIEPILRAAKAERALNGEQQAGEEQPTAASDELGADESQPAGPPLDVGSPQDRLFAQLERQLKASERGEARASLAKLLAVVQKLALPDEELELARQLERLAGLAAAAAAGGPAARLVLSAVGQLEGREGLRALSRRAFRLLDWSSPVWPHLRNLLLASLAAAAPSQQAAEDELAADIRRSLLLSHYVTSCRSLERCLQELLVGEASGERRAAPSVRTASGAAKTSGAGLFARRGRRVLAPAQNGLSGDQSFAGRGDAGGPARALTVKQVENLLHQAGEAGPAGAQIGRLVDLLAKLSLCLLRHADLLDAGRALLAAGRWHLAQGRRKLARQLWSALVELLDASPREDEAAGALRPAPRSLQAAVGALVDLPPELLLAPQRTAGWQRQLAEARQWLLESLICADSSAQGGEPAELPANWAKLGRAGATCLICARPAERQPSGAMSLSFGGGPQFVLHPDELAGLCELTGLQVDGRRLLQAGQLGRALQKAGQAAPASSAGRALWDVIEFFVALEAASSAT